MTLRLVPFSPSCNGFQEEEDVDTSGVAPGVAPKMSAAKAAKTASEKDARIAVRKPSAVF